MLNKIWSSLVMIHFTKCWFRLYPEELSSSNRITNQLMYVNPGGGEGGVKTRKKILMWNGLVSWGGVHTGQEEFIKQKCPINRKLSDFIRLFYFLTANNKLKQPQEDAATRQLVLAFQIHFAQSLQPRPRQTQWQTFLIFPANWSFKRRFANILQSQMRRS